MRVRYERPPATVIYIEPHRADVLPEVNLRSGLRRTKSAAQRRRRLHLSDGLGHFDHVVTARRADGCQRALDTGNRVFILDSEDHLADALIVVGENGSSNCHNGWGCPLEQLAEAV